MSRENFASAVVRSSRTCSLGLAPPPSVSDREVSEIPCTPYFTLTLRFEYGSALPRALRGSPTAGGAAGVRHENNSARRFTHDSHTTRTCHTPYTAARKLLAHTRMIQCMARESRFENRPARGTFSRRPHHPPRSSAAACAALLDASTRSAADGPGQRRPWQTRRARGPSRFQRACRTPRRSP